MLKHVRFVYPVLFFTAGIAAAAEASAPCSTTTIQIVGRVNDGATSMTGVTAAGAKVSVTDVTDPGNINIVPLQSGASSVTADDKGVFILNFNDPLQPGEKLRIAEQTASKDTPPKTTTEMCDLTVADIGDLGRIRFYFIGGEVLSRDTDFKSASSLFLAFNVDKNWKWGGKVKVKDGQANTADAEYTWDGGRWMWNTFFETRLTSVAEAQAPVAGTNTTSSTTTTSALSAFVGSRKSALMQAGNYFPFLVNHWKAQNAQNAMFIAPLVKIGFIAPTGDDTSTTSTGVATQPVNPAQFYNFYGYGGRIGHFKLSNTRNSAPELLSYLDVILGRFSNLDTLSPLLDKQGNPQLASDGKTPLTYPQRQYRIGMEGVWKIPTTPFLVGFNANIGQNLSGVRHQQVAKDDLRFFFGARFDIAKLFGQLKQLK